MTGEATISADRSSIFAMFRYIPLSLIAPRRATRELLDEPRLQLVSWTLIIAFSLFSALVATVYEWHLEGKQSSDAMLTSLNLEVTAVSLASYFLVVAAVNLAVFLLSKFLWKQLFLFFEHDNQVMAALALSAALGFLLDPALDGINLLLGDAETFGVKDALIAGYVIAGLVYGATYFSEALSIGWIRAFFTEFSVLFMLMICLGIPILITMYVLNPGIFTDVTPDTWTDVNLQIRQWITHEQV